MATNYPTSIDSFTNPGAGDPQNSPGALNHATQHDNINDSVAAIETYVGVTGSGVAGTVTKKLNDVISAQSTDATNISTNTTDITGLKAANPRVVGDGQIFIPAGASTGTAINNAMATLSAGGCIILGAGSHTLDVQVQFSSSVEIRGVSRMGTILNWNTSTFATAMKMVDTTNRRINLRDFTMFCSNPGAGCAIDMTYFIDSTLDNLFIGTNNTVSPLVGIDASNGGGGITYYNVISNCRVTASGVNPIGIKFGNGSNSNTVAYTRVLSIATGTGSGVQITGTATSSILLDHVDIESNPNTIAFDIGANATDVMIFEPYVEGMNTGLKVASGASFVKVFGGKFQGNTTDISDLGGNALSLQNVRSKAGNVAVGMRNNPTGAAIIFTGSGSLTEAQIQGAYALRVRCIGGGGGGGGAATATGTTAAHGGGGAGGSFAESTIATSTITFPVTVTVGASGTGGTAGANAGGAGGDSSFGALVIGKGGAGGAGGTALAVGVSAAGSVATTGGTGQILQDGAPGEPGFVVTGSTPFSSMGGFGGAAGSGAGGAYGNTGNGTNAGRNATANQGGGGSGGCTVNSGAQVAGGNGGSGIVIVEPLFG